LSAPLAGLTARGKALSGFIRSAIERGLGANETLELLQKQGLGYRRTDFLSDFRILKGAAEKGGLMKYVPYDKVMSPDLYPQGSIYEPYNMLTTVRVEGYDAKTGKFKEFYVTLGHDQPVTRREIEVEIERRKGTWDELYKEFFIIERMIPVGGRRRVG